MTTQPFDGQQAIQMWELEFTFGDRVRKARRVLGLTLDQLAEALSVKKQVVSQWETGVSNPRSPHAIARRIEYVYGIPAWWILGNDEAPADIDEGKPARLEGFEPPTFWSGVQDDFEDLGPDHLAQVFAFPGSRA
ncbi:MAG TPA: helix-turn-helix transcriptional regulator [Propionicimonas sp.]|jgi:transcriptional regulator with XRE-family HTH domain